MNRVTPEVITILQPKDNVLIGTNESGFHGAGIARYALHNWGAIDGQGFGPMGQCFGLPTKDWDIFTLPLDVINMYIQRYIAWTQLHQQRKTNCFVTKIGCGLAGLTPEEIAPMFADCLEMENIYLPQEFIDIINDKSTWKFTPKEKFIGIDTDKYGNSVGY